MLNKRIGKESVNDAQCGETVANNLGNDGAGYHLKNGAESKSQMSRIF